MALALHALLGTLLLVTAVSLIVRAVLARKAATTVIGAAALHARVEFIQADHSTVGASSQLG